MTSFNAGLEAFLINEKVAEIQTCLCFQCPVVSEIKNPLHLVARISIRREVSQQPYITKA